MKHRFLRAAAGVLLAAALLTMPCLADTIGGATVTGSNVRLRSSADTSSTANVLTEMPLGGFLLVEEKLDGWYKVIYNGQRGYVSADYASFAETLTGSYGFTASTGGTNVNLRADASTGAAVVKNLAAAGSALTVLGVSGQWLQVQDAAGAAGYIRSDLLNYASGDNAAGVTTGTGTTTAPAASTLGEKLVQTAAQFLGYRYTWGGMSPSTGFDCSGLVNYVCKQHGISLHRVAQDIYSNDGVAVSRDSLQPGDLLFFGYGPYSITHTGIYAGNGQMIHSSSSDTGVIYSDITSGYYSRMLVGAKRVA